MTYKTYKTLITKAHKNALLLYLNLEIGEEVNVNVKGNLYTINNQQYLVVVEEVSDLLQKEYLKGYIEEIILDEIPELYRDYFDTSKWLEDNSVSWERGNQLATYDGEEGYILSEDDIESYIYRIE